MTDIQFVGRNIKLPQDIKDYFQEKIAKHDNFLERNTGIVVTVKLNPNEQGGKRNYKAEISVSMPHAYIRVEENGMNLKAIADQLDPLLRRRLKRYHEQFKRWNKQEPWKVKEFEDSLPEVDYSLSPENFNDFEPTIKRKTYANDRPLHPAEAIEQMELIGHSSFLFKNIENDKYSMVYRRDEGGYGLIEPEH